jgi:serine/threonine protein phosphatase PrpC
MAASPTKFASAAASDQGNVRGNNEDRVYANDARGTYAVVDGMGGHEAGEHAAEIAVEHIRARLERQAGTAEQRLREAIALANNAIYEAAEEHPEWSGMACVLTAAVVEDGHATVGHVGDSRLYRIRRGAIEKVTSDHSPVGEREDAGELSEAEAMTHPRRNEVFRDVGSQVRTPDEEDFIEIRRVPFEPDAALLLCSDGLSDAIPSATILEIVERNAGQRERAAGELIRAATQTGRDNVSVVLVEGEQFGKHSKPVANHVKPAQRNSSLLPALALLIGLALGGGAVWWWLNTHPAPAVERSHETLIAPPAMIATALASSKSGDTLLLAPGTYDGDISLKDGVTIEGQRPGEAIINGSVSASGLERARLEGATVRGPVRIASSDVALVDDELGGGVSVSGNARGVIAGCKVRNANGPAIRIAGTAVPLIDENTIERGAAPALELRSSLRPVVRNNVFTGAGTAEPIWFERADPSVVDSNFVPGWTSKDKHPKFKLIPPEQQP